MADPFTIFTAIPTFLHVLNRVITLIGDVSHAPQIVAEIRKECDLTVKIVLHIEEQIKNHELSPFLVSDAEDTDQDKSSQGAEPGTGGNLAALLQDHVTQFKTVIEAIRVKLEKLKPLHGAESVPGRWIANAAIAAFHQTELAGMKAKIVEKRMTMLQLANNKSTSSPVLINIRDLQTQVTRDSDHADGFASFIRAIRASSHENPYSHPASGRYQRPVWTKSKPLPPPKLADQRKFMKAVRNDDRDTVGELLWTTHPNFSCADYNGLRPLQVAAQNGSIPMMQLLIASGADVDCYRASVSQTPLMLALASSHYNAAWVLITRGGADVGLADSNGQTALHIAARKNFLPIVNLLLSKGACPNAYDNTHDTPLMEAVCREGREIVPDDTTVLRALLEFKDPSTGQAQACQRLAVYTPMHHAARHGYMADLRVLAEFGTKRDIQAVDQWGQSPLWFAVQGGHVDAVKVLLENGATTEQRPKHQSWEGPTALWAMATSSCENANVGVRALLDAGADPNAPDSTAEKFTLMHRAARQGDISMLKLLLEYQANPCSEDNEGMQPIHEAAVNGHVHVIEYLLTKTDRRLGVDINCPTKTKDTPLILAATHGCIGVVRYLLSPRTPNDGPRPPAADLTRTNGYGNDALYMASSTGDIPCALLLLGAGADINMRNEKHNTPLHIAARRGHENMVRLLLQMGADAGAKSKEGADGIDVVGTPATVVRAFHERLGIERAERIAHIIEEWTVEDQSRMKGYWRGKEGTGLPMGKGRFESREVWSRSAYKTDTRTFTFTTAFADAQTMLAKPNASGTRLATTIEKQGPSDC
ncbi:ankyrin repeat-containing domain protein [Podospora appendiculata]|uniref:Ankyrin repeat-containing domain protein n=1 Tax=Podospora appendiculata TaxID=314037 RepID=A0AAE0XAZ8_9PEZI|nr:ankyrin repeat-containing domain protein [Podospora appendiculata]